MKNLPPMKRTWERRTFTPQEIETATAMRRRGVTWRILSETFRCDHGTLKRVIEPGYAEIRATQIREAAHKRGGWRKPGDPQHQVTRTAIPPDGVLLERDAALTAPTTLTAILCGDPPPGRSALDKKLSNLAEPPLLDPDIKVGLSPA